MSKRRATDGGAGGARKSNLSAKKNNSLTRESQQKSQAEKLSVNIEAQINRRRCLRYGAVV